MSARLTVIFYIILCLEVGLVLTLLPWIPHGFLGLSDWGDNYFLLYAAQKAGLQGLQRVVASGWVRGGVTGLGLLNLGMAFWEMVNFRRVVRALEGASANGQAEKKDAAQTEHKTDPLSDYRRRDDARDKPE